RRWGTPGSTASWAACCSSCSRTRSRTGSRGRTDGQSPRCGTGRRAGGRAARVPDGVAVVPGVRPRRGRRVRPGLPRPDAAEADPGLPRVVRVGGVAPGGGGGRGCPGGAPVAAVGLLPVLARDVRVTVLPDMISVMSVAATTPGFLAADWCGLAWSGEA